MTNAPPTNPTTPHSRAPQAVGLTEALTTNLGTYARLATSYAATGHARLQNTRFWLTPALEMLGDRAASILELGPADGVLTGALCDMGHKVTAVEFSGAMVQTTRASAPRATIIEAEFLAAPIRACFDLIIASAFIHLVPPPWDAAMLTKMRSLLAPGGSIFLATTLHTRYRTGFEEKKEGLPRYRTRYTRESVESLYQGAGLKSGRFHVSIDRLDSQKVWGNWLLNEERS